MFERTPQEPYRICYPMAREFRPDEVPYPFGLRAQHALGKLCLALAAGCSAQAEEPKKPAPVNPFPPERIRFRVYYTTLGFGVGSPESLSEAEAREVITAEFSRAGLKLEANRMIRDEHLSLELDGVTTDRRLGYEWVQWSNQAFARSQYRPDGDREASRPRLGPQERQPYLQIFEQCLVAACSVVALPPRPGDDQPDLRDEYDGLQNAFLEWASDYAAWKASGRGEDERSPKEPTVDRVQEWIEEQMREIRKHVDRDRKGLSPSEVRLIQRRAAQRRYFYALIDADRYKYLPRYVRERPTPGMEREDARERLRKDVRQFLEWARSQGAY